MTLHQFQLLEELEKVSAILEHGRLMAKNVENESTLFLYRVDSFFVAANYSRADQLTEITCFVEIDQALPHFRKQLFMTNPAEREFHRDEI
jgi:hypothetical protein